MERFVLTDYGFDIRQQAISGGHRIEFPHGAIGTGQVSSSEEAHALKDLIGFTAYYPIKKNYISNQNHLISIAIDNTGQEKDIMMTEAGIYARLIDGKTGEELIPEVLYAYMGTSKANYIPSAEQGYFYQEVVFDTTVLNGSEAEVTFECNGIYATTDDLANFSKQTEEQLEDTQKEFQKLITEHKLKTDNPHEVTSLQLGLDKVDNTPDKDKNVAGADKLTMLRKISVSGDVTGECSFDGSKNADINVALIDSGAEAGVYTKVTVDAKGRVTKGETLLLGDMPIGAVHDITYDKTNLSIAIPMVGKAEDLVINLLKDNFVSSGRYNAETENLELAMKNGGIVEIPVAHLIDVYSTGSVETDTVIINVGADNKISATLKVDKGEVLGISPDGSLTIDLSDYATKERLNSVMDMFEGGTPQEAVRITPSIDLNGLVKPGFYYRESGSGSNPNAPSMSSVAWAMMVIKHGRNNDGVIQIWMPFALTRSVFIRSYQYDSDGGWTEWKEIATMNAINEIKAEIESYSETINKYIDDKVDKVDGKNLSTNDYSNEDKTKLNSIASDANNYTHPTSDGNKHVPANGTTNNGKFLMSGSTAGALSWGTPTNTTYGIATTSANGLMSSADKTKLDGIAAGANKITVVNGLTSTSTTDALSAAQGKVLDDGKADKNHSHTAADVGAAASSHSHTAAQVGAVPLTGGTMTGVLYNEEGIVVGTLKSGTTLGTMAFAQGLTTTASGNYSHAQGVSTTASGSYSHAEGQSTTASKTTSHAEGQSTKASGNCSHAEGQGATASGDYSHAEGRTTTASGNNSHAEGSSTAAYGNNSHAEGSGSISLGHASHAEGMDTKASGDYSYAGGQVVIAGSYCEHAQGRYNKISTTSATSYNAAANAFVLGNGTNIALSNAFRVTFDGKVYGLSAFNSSGADYAEYFEWEDENINNEDRVGYFVTLQDNKIRIAKSTDDYILGIISTNPSVIGNAHSEVWCNMNLTDVWGRPMYEEQEVKKEVEIIHIDPILDEDGNVIKEGYAEEMVIREAGTEIVPVLNPYYDSGMTYIPREDRKEWTPVGMLGKLYVRDDGTCEPNGYCYPNDEGIATKSEKGYRVLMRIDKNIIAVLYR